MVSDFTSFSTTEPTIKMRTNNNTNQSSKSITTLCNQYGNNVKEYVFSIKKCPFGMVISPTFPLPTTSLIDFSLVDKLALPITDVQYRKLIYCGHKMRIVGKVSVTVQCVKDGSTADNVHIRAFVVLDLHNNLDVDSIASSKMSMRLTGAASLDNTSPSEIPTTIGSPCQQSSTSPLEAAGLSTSPPAGGSLSTLSPSGGPLSMPPIAGGSLSMPPAADMIAKDEEMFAEDAKDKEMFAKDANSKEMVTVNAKTRETIAEDVHTKQVDVTDSTKARIMARNVPERPPTHAELVARSEARRVRAHSRDNTDVCPDLHYHVRAIADTACLSPHAANLSLLDALFARADIEKETETQIQILLDVDGDGQLDEDPDGVKFTFITHDGSCYRPGHGRFKCSVDCSMKDDPPHNCGYHPDWILPHSFSVCGRRCKGAFCKCIRGGIFN